MSITSLGIVGGLASTALPQRAAEVTKTANSAADQSRVAEAAKSAEQAAGIGQTEEDAQTNDRDADGRRLWEQPPAKKPDPEPAPAPSDPQLARSKDPSGTCGVQLDLDG